MQRELRLECALVLMAALGFSQLAGAAHHPAANAEDRAVHFGKRPTVVLSYTICCLASLVLDVSSAARAVQCRLHVLLLWDGTPARLSCPYMAALCSPCCSLHA